MIIEYHSNIFKLWASIKSRKTVVQYVEHQKILEDTRRYQQHLVAIQQHPVSSRNMQWILVDLHRLNMVVEANGVSTAYDCLIIKDFHANYLVYKIEKSQICYIFLQSLHIFSCVYIHILYIFILFYIILSYFTYFYIILHFT